MFASGSRWLPNGQRWLQMVTERVAWLLLMGVGCHVSHQGALPLGPRTRVAV